MFLCLCVEVVFILSLFVVDLRPVVVILYVSLAILGPFLAVLCVCLMFLWSDFFCVSL